MNRRIGIVGGGAAGFFAAAVAGEANPDLRIVLFERSTTGLAKVAIAGGGRCNLTHACFDPRELINHYPRGGRELLGPFHAFQCRDTIDWFERHGVPLKTEADGRVFPTSDQSASVVDCLLAAVRQAGVELRFGTEVVAATPLPTGAFRLRLSPDGDYECDKLLLALGGGRGEAHGRLARDLGHTLTPLAPALFSFALAPGWLTRLPGVAVADAEVRLPAFGVRERGALLVTHWGITGPAVLRASSRAARELAACQYQTPVELALTPGKSLEQALDGLRQFARQHGRKQIGTVAPGDLPQRLWQALVADTADAERQVWAQLGRETMQALATRLVALPLRMNGRAPQRDEMVTCGGVSLKQVNFKTMASRLHPNLHFAGEMLDLDGLTGGFNLQAAWTTGYLAGQALAGE